MVTEILKLVVFIPKQGGLQLLKYSSNNYTIAIDWALPAFFCGMYTAKREIKGKNEK